MHKDHCKKLICSFIFALALCLNASCSQGKVNEAPVFFDASSIRMPKASGTVTMEKNGAFMDASNSDQGYVMVKCTGGKKIHKVGISTSQATYYYTLPEDGRLITCPLQMGDGDYTVQIFEQVSGTKYAPLCKWELDVKMKDDVLPYLYPNQFVDYSAADRAVKLSFEQCAKEKSTRKKAEKLYDFVAAEIDYDYDKAASVQSGYLPSPDKTLAEKKGICFDYAALLATMLRVQDIPARMQMGELAPDNVYHAWNLVCIDDAWYLMDATLDGQGYGDESYTAVKNY